MIRKAGRRLCGLPLGTASIQLTGTTVIENLTDGRVQFDTLSSAIHHFKPDGIGILADLTFEAEACGCDIAFPEFGLPYVVSHPVRERTDLSGLPVPDPRRDGRMPVTIETIELLSRRFGLPIGAGGIGPYTLAGELAGTQRVALSTKADPGLVHSLLEYATGVITAYNLAQVEAGADTLIIAEPAGSILSPGSFEEFSCAYLDRILRKLSVPVTLHVCGDSSHLVQELADLEPAGLSFDAPVNLPDIASVVPSSIIISGNLDPVDVVLELDPAELEKETVRLLEKMDGFDNYVLSSGCDIAPETSLENIRIIIDTVRRYRPGGER